MEVNSSGQTVWYISKYASPMKYFFGTRHFYYGEQWAKFGHQVCVISSNSSHLAKNVLTQFEGRFFRENIQEVDTIWLNTFSPKSARGLDRILSWFHFEWQLFRFSSRNLPKPTVIIISSLSIFSILNGYRLAKKYKAKLIFEIRDIWPLTPVEIGGYSKKHPFIRLLAWVERFGYKKADMIVGTMPNLGAHVKNVLPNYTKDVHCMPQGIDLDFYTKEQEPLPEGFIDQHIPKNKFVIGYAGAIGSSNRLRIILEAAKILLSQNQAIHIILLGDGDLKATLEEEAKELQNLTFAPRIKKSQVQGFLKHCDLLYDSVTKCTVYDFGLSRNKWMDYMYAGKPMIVSYSGYLSLINEANCGEAVPAENPKALADRILEYSQKPKEELEEMGKRGKQFLLENRTFEKLAKDYEKLFYD